MQSLSFRYYSATGNTRRAIEKMAEVARASGWTAELVPVFAKDVNLDLGKTDSALVLGFSVLGFSAARSLRRKLERAPGGGGRRVHLLAVCGSELRGERLSPGWPGQALEQVEAILKRRGYEVASSAFVSYPANWTQFNAPFEGPQAEKLLAEGDREAEAYAASILAGRAGLYRCGFGHRLWNVPVARLFSLIGRPFLGKIYACGTDCNNCGLCARSCPAQAIVLDAQGPRWTISCDACNRCINACPKRAIQASSFKLVLDLLVSALFIWACFPLTRLALGSFGIAYLGGWEGLIALAVATALTPVALAFLFGPVDSALRLVSRAPAFRDFLARGQSKGYGRYLAPGFRPAGEK